MPSFELDHAERTAQMRANCQAYGANGIRSCFENSFWRAISIDGSSHVMWIYLLAASSISLRLNSFDLFEFVEHRFGNEMKSWNSITRKCVWKICHLIVAHCFRMLLPARFINDSDQKMSTSSRMVHWNVWDKFYLFFYLMSEWLAGAADCTGDSILKCELNLG